MVDMKTNAKWLFIAWLAICSFGAGFSLFVFWARLYVGNVEPLQLLNIAVFVLLLAGAALSLDRFIDSGEHLAAEQRLAREYLALKACAEVIHSRIDRGIRVQGTPLHIVAMDRKRRALAAIEVAQKFRDRRK